MSKSLWGLGAWQGQKTVRTGCSEGGRGSKQGWVAGLGHAGPRRHLGFILSTVDTDLRQRT